MIRVFLRDSVLYTIANLFTKGIGFVMLPIYIRYLSKDDYCTFDYITAVGAFISVIIALEITQAVLRFASEYKEHTEKSRYIANGVIFNMFCYAFLLLVSWLFIDDVSLFLTGNENEHFIAILAVVNYSATSALYMSTIVYRSLLDSKSSTLSSAASTAMVAIFSVLLLKYFDASLESMLLGSILGQYSIALYNYFKLREYWFYRPNFVILKNMLSFSAPLVLSSIGVIMATLIDRMMVKEMLSYSDLAEYGVAARFASITTILTMGFQSALTPLIYSELDNPKLRYNIQRLFALYAGASIILAATLFVFSVPLVRLVAGENYVNSSLPLSLLAAAVLVQSGYVFFPGLSIKKKTFVLAKINIAVGCLNLVGNFTLIPILGITGAAVSTLFSSFIFFGVNFYLSEKQFPIYKESESLL